MKSRVLSIVAVLLLQFQSVVEGQNSGGLYMSMMGEDGKGAGGGGLGTLGKLLGRKELPPGYANIRGEIMDMRNKLLQRVSSVGTNYFTFDNQNGSPTFRRREMDLGRKFVLFPDPLYPQGDGKYIVLRKMPGVTIPGMMPAPLYEAFRLSLGDSIHAYMGEFNPKDVASTLPNVNERSFNGLMASNGQQTSGYGISNAPTSPIGLMAMRGRRRRRREI